MRKLLIKSIFTLIEYQQVSGGISPAIKFPRGENCRTFTKCFRRHHKVLGYITLHIYICFQSFSFSFLLLAFRLGTMTTSLTKGIFIVAAKRTPFGTAGGKFVKTSSCDLQTVAAKAALTAANIAPEKIDNVVIGNVLSISSADGIFVARHTQLRCDIPKEVPALVVNRLCGTGFQSIVTAAQGILVGDSKIALTGGTDNMSQQPFVVRNVRYGVPLGSKIDFEDSLWLGLTDSYCNMPMGMTAEKLGAQYKLTRDEVDEFALRSQQLWKKAQDGGVFKEELAPVTVKIKGKEVVVDTDEHPKPQTTIEGLKKLKPVFVKDGLVTAGSASGICDGAGAVIIASEEAVKANNLTPLARLVGYGITGVDPTIMGIGPAPAIRDVLKAAGKTLDDLDMVEVNEAFGAQTLAVAKELKLDMNKLNMNGGAIALGHPLAASGARITAHMVHELRRRKAKLGVASACIGGGQGIALLIESC